ncbi:MAG: metallopeptidase TldD-related protein [Planctomycetes bacterium]|nr:metallopeptidase TldD-related protein [Planctomycetota bacterium]
MQEYFNDVADVLQGLLQKDEVYTASFSGEDSDFVRFNKSAVRQAGAVTQRAITVDLIEGRRHAAGTTTLTGDLELDRPRLVDLVKDLRETRAHVPEDPYLLYATEVRSGERAAENRLPDGAAAVGAVRDAGQGRDLVGIYAAGGIHSGFASSLGQRNWYTSYSYNLDWCFYHRADKAVKTNYAGFEWDPAAFARKVELATEQLAVVAHTPVSIKPGQYRVYLTPAALYELVGLLSWGGFGLKAHRTKQTPLIRMIEGDARLAPGVSITEHTAQGVAPNFQGAGFIRPERVDLIKDGAFAQCLVSPRSAQEYGVPTNGASSRETPESVEVSAGTVPQADALARLDTGVWVGNLWYLNYSDRTACRTTGMTRFATFWVENGQIKAPLDVMRFDETIYRVLGQNLDGLTAEREMILDSDTYFKRSTVSGRLPGALVNDFSFTL